MTTSSDGLPAAPIHFFVPTNLCFSSAAPSGSKPKRGSHHKILPINAFMNKESPAPQAASIHCCKFLIPGGVGWSKAGKYIGCTCWSMSAVQAMRKFRYLRAKVFENCTPKLQTLMTLTHNPILRPKAPYRHRPSLRSIEQRG